MGLFINTNASALKAQRQLNQTTGALSRSFERLSSGLRINGAKDDAAGLSISTRFTSQIRGLNQAVRNSNDGISLSQTAEGALNETTNILQRIRELAVQAANDTNNDSDRASLQAEVDQLKSELDRIATTTNFNGNNLLDGTFLGKDIQVGAQVGETLSVSVDGAGLKQLARQARYTGNNAVSSAGFTTSGDLQIKYQDATQSSGFNTANIRSTVAADDTLSTTLQGSSAIAKAAAINDSSATSGVRAIVGESQETGNAINAQETLDQENYLEINGKQITGFTVEANDANGTLVDAINAVSDETGVVATVDANSRIQLTAEDGRNINVDVVLDGASSTGTLAGFSAGTTFGKITLQSDDTFEVVDGSELIGFDTAVVGSSTVTQGDGVYGVNSDQSMNSVDISTRDGALTAIDVVDLALENVSSSRAKLGALQNRLESTINNLTTTSENLSASRSRILDADFASETATLSRNQIIQQAGVSILAQANQQPQVALALLG
jgi:flagellin